MPDARRPRFHFAPDGGWMNDPNGLFRRDGQWHLYYQKSVAAPEYRVIGWGHATSDDLLQWRDLGMAIPPDEQGYVYSGSVVVAPDGLVAFMTRHDPVSGRQVQMRAVSEDGGLSWRYDPATPVIDEGLTAFRDPFMVSLTDGSLRMITVKPVGWHDWDGHRSQIAVHRSADGRDWQPCGAIGIEAANGELFEVPVLLRLPVDGDRGDWRWVLVVSIVDRRGDLAACRAVAWIGDFDGSRFTAEAGPLPMDYGPDWYAPTSFAGLEPGDAVLIGWLGNWQYARPLSALKPIGPTQSLPRRVSLGRDGEGAPALRHWPAAEPAQLAADQLGPLAIDIDATRRQLPAGIAAGVLAIALDCGSAHDVRIALPGALLSIDAVAKTVTLERGDLVGLDPAHRFAGRWSAPLGNPAAVDLRIFIDRGSIELFIDEGAAVISAQAFTDGPAAIEFWTTGGRARATARADVIEA